MITWAAFLCSTDILFSIRNICMCMQAVISLPDCSGSRRPDTRDISIRKMSIFGLAILSKLQRSSGVDRLIKCANEMHI